MTMSYQEKIAWLSENYYYLDSKQKQAISKLILKTIHECTIEQRRNEPPIDVEYRILK